MLMLTHAWLLAHLLGPSCFDEKNQDLFIYNVCPDFLPVHPSFTSDTTHGISRFRKLPDPYRKGAFVHFHLMVDDMSHHGFIHKIPIREFNPDSQGYTYIKGRPLVRPLMDLSPRQGTPIDPSVAAYQSHMIIEMIFDLALYLGKPDESNRLIVAMCDAMQSIIRDHLDDFSGTVGWLYDASPQDVASAVKQCASIYTPERMNGFMTMEGRIKLFGKKFGLDTSDHQSMSILKEIMTDGMSLVADYEEFLDPTLAAIRKAGFDSLA